MCLMVANTYVLPIYLSFPHPLLWSLHGMNDGGGGGRRFTQLQRICKVPSKYLPKWIISEKVYVGKFSLSNSRCPLPLPRYLPCIVKRLFSSCAVTGDHSGITVMWGRDRGMSFNLSWLTLCYRNYCHSDPPTEEPLIKHCIVAPDDDDDDGLKAKGINNSHSQQMSIAGVRIWEYTFTTPGHAPPHRICLHLVKPQRLRRRRPYPNNILPRGKSI